MKFISQEVRNAIDWAAQVAIAGGPTELREELRRAREGFAAQRALEYGELRALSAAALSSGVLLGMGGLDIVRAQLGVQAAPPTLPALRAARDALEAQAATVARRMA